MCKVKSTSLKTYKQIGQRLYEEGIKRKMTREEKQDLCEIWESIFTEVVDVECQEMFIRLFEDEEQCYLISFDGTEKINSIEDWK